MSKNKSKNTSGTIAQNKKARHDYSLTDKFEAGIVLRGWEVKSLRQGKIQITDTTRTRKLLLHAKELSKLQEAVQQKGYTCVCTALYWKKHLIKAEICLAKGKQDHDKRETEKNRDWERQKMRIVRDHN